MDSSFEVPLFAFLLVDEGPAEIRAYKVFVAPSVEWIKHGTFATAKLEYSGLVINKLCEEIFEKGRLNVPIIDLLLFEFVAGIPVTLDIIFWQILGESVLNEKLFVFA